MRFEVDDIVRCIDKFEIHRGFMERDRTYRIISSYRTEYGVEWVEVYIDKKYKVKKFSPQSFELISIEEKLEKLGL